MINVSDDFNNAMKAENRRLETRIKIGDKVFTKNDINNWVYSGGSISGETFQIGSTFSNSIKIEFCSILENVKELTEVTVELGIATYDADYHYDSIPPEKVGSARIGYAKLIYYKPTVYEYVSIGTFYVTKCDPNRNENRTTLEASDRFIFLENEYVSELTFPASIRDVALEIANKSGSVINKTNFSMISTKKISKPEGYTYRQAIGLIAQFEAGYARFNRTNHLEIMQLIDPKFAVSPAEYFQKGLTKNELMYKIGGISCTVSVQSESGNEQVTYFSGSNTGPQIILENKVMTQNLLDSIYQKVKDVNFYPFSLNWRGNPALESGDWLTLADRDGTQFKTPNLSYTLTFKGGLTATSSANTNSSAQTVSAYSPPLNQIIKEVNSRIDAAGKNSVYDGIENPPYPKEGDIWFKKNGPDDEIWIYTKLADGTYDWVMTTSTRLSDEIQEKIDNSVPSDEIVKTINLSQEMDGKEWLKITGAKIWLTDQTRIDDAIIQDAMIGNLSASKLTAGTINASDVNIINLNASNISTGTLTGTNLAMNLNTGEVLFQKGIIKKSDDKFLIDITNGEISSDSADGGFSLKNGSLYLRRRWDNKEYASIKWGLEDMYTALQSKAGIEIKGLDGFSIKTSDSEFGSTEYSPSFNLIKGSGIFGYNGQSSMGLRMLSAGGIHLSGGKTYTNRSGRTALPSFDVGGSTTIVGEAEALILRTSQSKDNYQLIQMNSQGVLISSDLQVDKLTVTKGLSVIGSKNAIHVTRDGIRATPAYELAESYLGDIGRNYTREDCEIWIDIDEIFSDIVNSDIAYEVFLQAYDQANFWIEDFKPNKFLVKSDKPMSRFAWEIKAKRRGYENERLVFEKGMNNQKIENLWG